jgi:hypothetical protein
VLDSKIISTPTRTANLYCEDAVEVFFDPNGIFTRPPSYDAETRQFMTAAPSGMGREARSEIWVISGKPLVTGNLSNFPVAGGYVYEGFITANELGSPVALAAGGNVGFNPQIDVTSVSGPQIMCPRTTIGGTYILRVGGTGCGKPYCDVGSFCTPVLR